MDSTQWSSETSLAIEETFGKGISTLPSYEPTYRLLFRDFNSNSELEQIRKLKNIIIAAPIDDEHNVANLIRAILSDEVEERVRSGESFAFPRSEERRVGKECRCRWGPHGGKETSKQQAQMSK